MWFPRRETLALSACALISGAWLAELSAPKPARAIARERPATRAPDARAPAHATATTASRGRAPREAGSEPVAKLDESSALTLRNPIERALGSDFKDGLIITGRTHRRVVLFTFDDGPDPRTTPLLLDRLDEAGIKAVFFLVANRIGTGTPIEREQAMLAREIVRRGHMVGGHTVDHVQLPLLEDSAVREQLKGAENIYLKVLGARPWIIRPPFGAHSQRIDQLLAQRGYTTVLWNLGGEDFQAHTAEETYRTWLRNFEHGRQSDDGRGGIVLLHDIHPWSVDAFQMIVAHLMARNCELLERGEELFDFVDDLSFFYVPRADATPETEAPPAEPDPALLAQRQAQLRERTARRCKSMASAF